MQTIVQSGMSRSCWADLSGMGTCIAGVRSGGLWLLTVHSATHTSPRTHHRNPGLDIRAIFEEGRENAKQDWATAVSNSSSTAQVSS